MTAPSRQALNTLLACDGASSPSCPHQAVQPMGYIVLHLKVSQLGQNGDKTIGLSSGTSHQTSKQDCSSCIFQAHAAASKPSKLQHCQEVKYARILSTLESQIIKQLLHLYIKPLKAIQNPNSASLHVHAIRIMFRTLGANPKVQTYTPLYSSRNYNSKPMDLVPSPHLCVMFAFCYRSEPTEETYGSFSASRQDSVVSCCNFLLHAGTRTRSPTRALGDSSSTSPGLSSHSFAPPTPSYHLACTTSRRWRSRPLPRQTLLPLCQHEKHPTLASGAGAVLCLC